MNNIFFYLLTFLSFQSINAQVYVGQSVPDIIETDCNNNSERIYDMLASGKPVLVFKTDMATCSNTTAWGTTVRQYADVYASQYRTWVCADFQEAVTATDQCFFMDIFEQETGLNTNNVFRFIDTTSVGPYNPNSRSGSERMCYQGYVVIALDSTIAYVGNDMNSAVAAALDAAQSTGTEEFQSNFTISVYPNPVSGFLNIISDEKIESLKIYNQIGLQVITFKELISNTIDISLLENGVYFFEFKVNSQIKTKLIIKN
jgi:hypothetical protein